MAEVVHTALDGSRVRVTAPYELDAPGSTAFVVADGGSFRQEFGSGDLILGELVASAHGINLNEEYAFQGGRLRIGSTEKYDEQVRLRYTVRLGVWEGQRYSVKTLIFGGTSTDLIGLYDLFDIRETSTGVILDPRQPRIRLVREGRGAPDIIKPIGGVGLATVFKLTPTAARTIPPWAGKPVRGGELFVRNANIPDRLFLVLVAESAVGYIEPNDSASEEALVAGASELTLDWLSME